MAPSSHLFCRSFNLSRILGLPVGDFTWHQAKLPVSMGGLGLRTAENHAPAAYAASTLSSQLLVQDLVGARGPPLLAVAQPGGVANEPRPTLSAQNTGGLVCSSRGGSNCSRLGRHDHAMPDLPLSHCVMLVIRSTHLPSLLQASISGRLSLCLR